MDFDGKAESWLPATGGRFLLSGEDVVDQCGHNDFAVKDTLSPGYFVIVSGIRGASLMVCPGSQKYVRYNPGRRELIRRSLQMEEIMIPPLSMFIGHGYLQHAGAGWRGHHAVRYHTYVAPTSHPLPDAISFAYDWSMSRGDGTNPLEEDPAKPPKVLVVDKMDDGTGNDIVGSETVDKDVDMAEVAETDDETDEVGTDAVPNDLE